MRNALQQEHRLAAVVRDSNDAIIVQDFGGRIIAWNRRAAEIYGYSEEEALQTNASVLIPEQARVDMRALLERLQHGENVPPCESWRKTSDGRMIKIWLMASVLLDDAGMPMAVARTEREMT